MLLILTYSWYETYHCGYIRTEQLYRLRQFRTYKFYSAVNCANATLWEHISIIIMLCTTNGLLCSIYVMDCIGTAIAW